MRRFGYNAFHDSSHLLRLRCVLPHPLGVEVRLAFVGYSSNNGGSTISGEMIVSGILDRGWDVDVYYAFDGPFVERMKQDRCSVTLVPHSSWLRHSGVLRFLRDLWVENSRSAAFESEFRRTKPDIVYVNSLVSYAAARAAHRLGIPLVWHMRELFSDEFGEMVCPALFAKDFVRRLIPKLATKLIVNSAAVGGNIFGSGNRVPFETIPNAVDSKFFRPLGDRAACRRSLNLPSEGPLVGLPGTLRPVKGHEFLFRSIPSILERIPDCIFAVTGAIDSKFARDLVALSEASPFAERVFFTGNIGDMVSFYHGCDVCCVPSLSESFGRTAIECFATRTPVVASAVGGLKEIIQDGKNGLIVPYGEDEALADSIVSLLNEPERAQRLVEQAALDVKARYTERVYVERISAIIDDALAVEGR